MIKVIDDVLTDVVCETMHDMIQSTYIQWQYDPQ